jgi:hypothetical protein
MFRQKDYWQMSDKELATLAAEYNIDAQLNRTVVAVPGFSVVGEETLRNRPEVIAALVARDTIRQASVAQTLSIISFVVALAALIVSIIK